MGNIITKDPDTIHWESNKNNSNQLTNDAQKLLGLLPDKLDEFSAWFIEQGSLTLKNKNVLKRRMQ